VEVAEFQVRERVMALVEPEVEEMPPMREPQEVEQQTLALVGEQQGPALLVLVVPVLLS
jgi:hypothetical protein